MGCLVFNRSQRAGMTLLWTALYILSAHVLVALLLVSLQRNVRSFFDWVWLIESLSLFLAIAALIGFFGVKPYRSLRIIKTNGEVIAFSLVVFGCFFFAFWISTYTPAFAWDSLDHWLPEAARLVKFLGNDSSPDFHIQYIHPFTGAAILAWYTFGDCFDSVGIVGFAPMFLIAGASIGFNKYLGGPPELSVIILLAIFAVPLGTNHAIAFGYVDLWVAAAVNMACCFAYILVVERNFQSLAGFMACLVIVFAWRNDSSVYIFSLIAALILHKIYAAEPMRRLGISAAVLFFALLVFYCFYRNFNFQSFKLGNYGFQFDGEITYLWIGQRRLIIEFQSLYEVLRSLGHSILVNSSFSVLGLTWLVSFIFQCIGRREDDKHHLILFFMPLVILGVFFAAMAASPFFYKNYAAINNNTGLSRFMLAWAYACLPAIIYSASFASIKPQTDGRILDRKFGRPRLETQKSVAKGELLH